LIGHTQLVLDDDRTDHHVRILGEITLGNADTCVLLHDHFIPGKIYAAFDPPVVVARRRLEGLVGLGLEPFFLTAVSDNR